MSPAAASDSNIKTAYSIKVKHRTIANLSHCSFEEIDAIKLALKHKKNLDGLVSLSEDITLHQGCSIGAVCAIHDIARLCAEN